MDSSHVYFWEDCQKSVLAFCRTVVFKRWYPDMDLEAEEMPVAA